MDKTGTKELATAITKCDAFKCLNVTQAALLANSMTAVSYEKGETIIKQGDNGDSFYIIRRGGVTLSEKKTLGKSKDVGTLRDSDCFGEMGLLKKETRQFTATATSKTKCLSISRSEFEKCLGSTYQDLVEADKKMKTERSLALSRAGPPLAKINRYKAVLEDDVSKSVVCTSAQDRYLLKIYSKASIVSHDLQEPVMREIELLKSLSKVSAFAECISIPVLVSTYIDNNCLYILYEEPVSCSLPSLAEEFPNGVFDEACAKHITMCVLLALEAIHSEHVVYRGIAPEGIAVTQNGVAMLCDFHNSRQNPDGNVTICGTPEYLAPEVVQQQGHGLPCDYWSLGVLVYEMLTGETPFEAGNELDVYAKIGRHAVGSLKPGKAGSPQISQGCSNFIDQLMCPDPKKRPGSKATKNDKWFTKEEWKKLENKSLAARAASRMALIDKAGVQTASSGSVAFKGDDSWCAGW